ncbi:MAG TPA: tetratricopeptide repeat protein, partial [Gemmatimonadales bacterium]|nr:tetratricopeptide repeat protein [Gemmatimonadales bacterium]
LAKSPADRFPDMNAFDHELKRAAGGTASLELAGPQGERSRPPSENLEAYDSYLRGIHSFNKRTARGNQRAIELLEQATRLDPSFALAFAALAEAYIEQFFTYDPQEEWEEKAFVAIERGRAVDPGLARIYVAKGNLLWTRARRFPHAEALAEYRRALALNPDSVEALNELARVLWHIGQLDPAAAAFERAIALDPAFIDGRFRLGWVEQCRGNYARALELLRMVPVGSLAPSADCLTALTLLYLDRKDAARQVLARVDAQHRDDPDFASTEAIFLALEGDAGAAEQRIATAIAAGQALGHFHHVEYNIAVALALLGQTQHALEVLRRAAEGGFPCYPWFERDPLLASLKGEPEFRELLAELKTRWGTVR